MPGSSTKPRRHRGGSSWLRSSTLRPPRRHASRPWQPEGDPRRQRYTPALLSTQGVVGPHTLSRPAVSFISVRSSHARAPTTSSTASERETRLALFNAIEMLPELLSFLPE